MGVQHVIRHATQDAVQSVKKEWTAWTSIRCIGTGRHDASGCDIHRKVSNDRYAVFCRHEAWDENYSGLLKQHVLLQNLFGRKKGYREI